MEIAKEEHIRNALIWFHSRVSHLTQGLGKKPGQEDKINLDSRL